MGKAFSIAPCTTVASLCPLQQPNASTEHPAVVSAVVGRLAVAAHRRQTLQARRLWNCALAARVEPPAQSHRCCVVSASWTPAPTEGTPDPHASGQNPAAGYRPPPLLRPDCRINAVRTVTAETDAGTPCIQPRHYLLNIICIIDGILVTKVMPSLRASLTDYRLDLIDLWATKIPPPTAYSRWVKQATQIFHRDFFPVRP